MLIIIEGAARTGKSSLAKCLKEDLDGAVDFPVVQYKSSQRSNNPFLSMLDLIVPMAYDDETVYIVDRCHLTEMVYTFITGRKTNYPMPCIGLIDSLFSHGKTMLLYMGASIETLERRAEETGRETEGDISSIQAAFMTCINLTKIRDIMILDSDKFDTEQLSAQVVERFKLLAKTEETVDDEEFDDRATTGRSISRRSEITSRSLDEESEEAGFN